MDQTFRQSLRAITNELRDSGFGDDGTDHVTSHPAVQTVSTDRVIFQRRMAFEGTPADWSTPITFELVGSPGENAGNGIDDDNDGTVDERRLARTQDGATTILADGFDVMNITRQLGENWLQVTLGSSRSLRAWHGARGPTDDGHDRPAKQTLKPDGALRLTGASERKLTFRNSFFYVVTRNRGGESP